MPLDKKNLPPSVKGMDLSEHEIDIFIKAANAALKEYGDDVRAIKVGIAAAKGDIKHNDEIPGGLGDNETLSDLAKKHDVSIEQIKKEFAMGVKVEREHTSSDEKAAEIALDHLTEHYDYYTKLKLAEQKMNAEDDKEIEWITVKGNHIPILDGETKEEAINKFIEDKKTQSDVKDKLSEIKGQHLELKKSHKISTNMGKAMAKGFYPEEQVRLSLSKSTKQGKELQKLFEENKKYKQNYKIVFEDDQNPETWDWDANDFSKKSAIFVDNLEDVERKKVVHLKKLIK